MFLTNMLYSCNSWVLTFFWLECIKQFLWMMRVCMCGLQQRNMSLHTHTHTHTHTLHMSQLEKSPLWIQSPEETSRIWIHGSRFSVPVPYYTQLKHTFLFPPPSLYIYIYVCVCVRVCQQCNKLRVKQLATLMGHQHSKMARILNILGCYGNECSQYIKCCHIS